MSAASVPLGSTLTRVYYASPTHYTIGAARETFAEALADGIAWHEALVARYLESYTEEEQASPNFLPMPEKFVVDTRWVMQAPLEPGFSAAGSHDFTADRETFPDLETARKRLAAIPERFRTGTSIDPFYGKDRA